MGLRQHIFRPKVLHLVISPDPSKQLNNLVGDDLGRVPLRSSDVASHLFERKEADLLPAAHRKLPLRDVSRWIARGFLPGDKPGEESRQAGRVVAPSPRFAFERLEIGNDLLVGHRFGEAFSKTGVDKRPDSRLEVARVAPIAELVP